jgi:hypothetical protein
MTKDKQIYYRSKYLSWADLWDELRELKLTRFVNTRNECQDISNLLGIVTFLFIYEPIIVLVKNDDRYFVEFSNISGFKVTFPLA